MSNYYFSILSSLIKHKQLRQWHQLVEMGKRPSVSLNPEYLRLIQEHKSQEKKIKLEPVSNEVVDLPKDNLIGTQEPLDADLRQDWHSDTSDEDNWDSVSLGDEAAEQVEVFGTDQPDPDNAPSGDIVLTFSAPPKKVDRLPKIPKAVRLEVHYLTLAALLLHSRLRNRWTAAPEVQNELKHFLPLIILQELHPADHLSTFLCSKKLNDGLRHAVTFWRNKFEVTGPGLSSVTWEEMLDKDREVEGKVSKNDFIESIRFLRGSTDVFSQGFCALLRAVGLECRLACSLQPTDFTSIKAGPKKQKPSNFPIYWTEVWNPYMKTWITADPLTDYVQAIGKVSKLEPPKTDSRNILRYVVVWSDKDHVRDVTRRYTNHFNSRTRKKRMAYAGEQYALMYEQLLGRYSKKSLSERDLEELNSLSARQKLEGMPSNVQDFVNHPQYALEHQLHKNQYIEPRTACGSISLKNGVVSVFPRKNVHTCHSAQTWYKRGRTIANGMQPKVYRTVKNHQKRETETVGLYSRDQTVLYAPPAIGRDGIVPKSQYRTIDIFTPTMIPQGGVHITCKFAQQAAKLLGVDYANAVVGVDFGKDGPKSKYDGIVIAQACEEAVRCAVTGIEEIAREQEELEENLRIMVLWRRLIVAAQIRERIDRMNVETEHGERNRPCGPTETESMKQTSARDLAVDPSLQQIRVKAKARASPPPARIQASPTNGTLKASVSIPISEILGYGWERKQVATPAQTRQPPAADYRVVPENSTVVTEKSLSPVNSEGMDDSDFPDCFLDEVSGSESN